MPLAKVRGYRPPPAAAGVEIEDQVTLRPGRRPPQLLRAPTSSARGPAESAAPRRRPISRAAPRPGGTSRASTAKIPIASPLARSGTPGLTTAPSRRRRESGEPPPTSRRPRGSGGPPPPRPTLARLIVPGRLGEGARPRPGAGSGPRSSFLRARGRDAPSVPARRRMPDSGARRHLQEVLDEPLADAPAPASMDAPPAAGMLPALRGRDSSLRPNSGGSARNASPAIGPRPSSHPTGFRRGAVAACFAAPPPHHGRTRYQTATHRLTREDLRSP